MKWLKCFFGKKQGMQKINVQEKMDSIVEPVEQQEDNIVSDLKNIQNGAEEYDMRELGEDVYFVQLNRGRACWIYNERKAILIPLVSRDGSVLFLNESDIEDKAIELIENECPQYLMSANFRFWVYPFKDGQASVEWTVRPDGMYWADEDGYGMTDDEAITLCGKITPDGKQVGKFCLYE